MCGRFTRHEPPQRWAVALGAAIDAPTLATIAARDTGPRYNIPPGTTAWIAALDASGAVAFDELKWAFPTSRGNRINVRSETAHVVPEYREPFHCRRCVVLASGFYEPKGAKAVKVRPWYYFAPRDDAPLFLGAIAKAEGFSILTRASVAPVALVHDRTPVLVPAENVVAWLDPEIRGGDAMQRFAPADWGARLVGWPVGDGAKRPANEGATLIEPVGPERLGRGG